MQIKEPFHTVTTLVELKKWYDTGKFSKSKATLQITRLIKDGKENKDLIKADECFFFHNAKHIETFRTEYDKTKTFVPVNPPPIDISSFPSLHESWRLFLEFWNHSVCGGQVTKGWGWTHIHGVSNSWKSFFVAHTFCAILPTATVVFSNKWPQGFQENTYQVIFVDGVTKETIKNGFTTQLMEHATVGTDDHFIFPQKYAVKQPKTNGELWITTGNHRMKDIVDEDTWNDIVRYRVREIEVRDVTNLPALANIIRRRSGLSQVAVPQLVVPPSFKFSQSQTD